MRTLIVLGMLLGATSFAQDYIEEFENPILQELEILADRGDRIETPSYGDGVNIENPSFRGYRFLANRGEEIHNVSESDRRVRNLFERATGVCRFLLRDPDRVALFVETEAFASEGHKVLITNELGQAYVEQVDAHNGQEPTVFNFLECAK